MHANGMATFAPVRQVCVAARIMPSEFSESDDRKVSRTTIKKGTLSYDAAQTQSR